MFYSLNNGRHKKVDSDSLQFYNLMDKHLRYIKMSADDNHW